MDHAHVSSNQRVNHFRTFQEVPNKDWKGAIYSNYYKIIYLWIGWLAHKEGFDDQEYQETQKNIGERE